MNSSTKSMVLFSGNGRKDQPAIQAYAMDEETGKLELLAAFSGFLNPSYILPHPAGKWVYATSETSQEDDGIPGSVLALRFDQNPFRLQVINQQPTGADWPCHLRLDRTGRWLFATNYKRGSLDVWPVQADGSLGPKSDADLWQGQGPNPERQAGAHAHSSILSPDNRFVIVADLGSDLLVVHQFDPSTGKFSLQQRFPVRPGAGPRHMIFHPDGRKLFVSNELASTVTVYAYDELDGGFSELQNLGTVPPGAPENIAADIHLSNDARHLYVSNRGHNSLAVFALDGQGALTPAGFYDCGGNWPRNFAISPTGRFILVANQYSQEITSLPLDSLTGLIGAVVDRINIPHATCVQFVNPAN